MFFKYIILLLVVSTDASSNKILAPLKKYRSHQQFESTQKRCDQLRHFLKNEVFEGEERFSTPSADLILEIESWLEKPNSTYKSLMDAAVECEEGLMRDLLAATYLQENDSTMESHEETHIEATRSLMVDAIIALENILALVRQQPKKDIVNRNTFWVAEVEGEREPLIDLPFGQGFDPESINHLKPRDKIKRILELYTSHLKIDKDEQKVIERHNMWTSQILTSLDKDDVFKTILQEIKNLKSATEERSDDDPSSEGTEDPEADPLNEPEVDLFNKRNVDPFNLVEIGDKWKHIEYTMTKAQQAAEGSEWIGPFLTNLHTTTITTLKLTAAIQSYVPQFKNTSRWNDWENMLVPVMKFLTSLRIYFMHASRDMDEMVEEYLLQGGETQQKRREWKTKLSRELLNCGITIEPNLLEYVELEPQDLLKKRIKGGRSTHNEIMKKILGIKEELEKFVTEDPLRECKPPKIVPLISYFRSHMIKSTAIFDNFKAQYRSDTSYIERSPGGHRIAVYPTIMVETWKLSTD
eukprot:GHVL01005493.1.p1 GENE.GHVL01005493.1~~GHVL01005493.1.p1  ORF type:complete len:525 (+),score=94.48 GHVL01005493.1:26-1600(+)